MRRRLMAALGAACFSCCWQWLRPCAQEKFIVVSSTTSTEQSGLFGYLLPIFERDTGIKVRVVALGTGQALDMARRGDADVVFVHDQPAEEKFVAEGFGCQAPSGHVQRLRAGRAEERSGEDRRRQGHPRGDAQGRRGAGDVRVARRQERHARGRAALLEGRGRRSRCEEGPWYKDTGSGMGPTLNTASSMNGYVLTDRGTWLSFKNRGDLVDPGRRRQAPVQPVRRDARESGEASAREEGPRASSSSTGSYRPQRAGGDRGLQDRRRAAVLSERAKG